MIEHYDVVIAGAGQAGGQCAISLRDVGFAGSILLIGDEPEHPYERPPLSKAYFSGEQPFERLLLRPEEFWREKNIVVRTGERVCAVDPEAREVSTAAGARIGYGRLVWAAGCAPRRLSCVGGDLAGVHVLRTRADADHILRELPTARRVAIVGGGYIGLEAAAVLSELGLAATVYEAQPRLLARVAGDAISAFYQREHEARGVSIRTKAQILSLEGDGSRVSGVRLADGRVEPADLVLVGIGVNPQVEPLVIAGAQAGDGVNVDEFCRTSLPDVFAIGDCAAHENSFAGGARIRLESYQNANDMALCVAQAIQGVPQPYGALPWFWSDQYDLKLQSLGLAHGHDEEVVRGDPASRAFAVAYLKEGRMAALDCVNAPRDFVQGRGLVSSHAKIDRAQFADPGTPLRQTIVA